MSKLPRSADRLNDEARRDLERLIDTFPKYRLEKLDNDLSFPLTVRMMSTAFERYKAADGSALALCQALFPAKHIDMVLSFLDHEAVAVLASMKGLAPARQEPGHRLKLKTLQNDYKMLRDIEFFLKPLARQGFSTYEPWDPNEPHIHF